MVSKIAERIARKLWWAALPYVQSTEEQTVEHLAPIIDKELEEIRGAFEVFHLAKTTLLIDDEVSKVVTENPKKIESLHIARAQVEQLAQLYDQLKTGDSLQ